MERMNIAETRADMVARILAKQDAQYRWSYDEQVARERPELTYYWPKYNTTLWTLLLLADLRAPSDIPQVHQAFDLVAEHFYDPANKIFSLGKSHFPIPCLNGNMLYLHFFLQWPYTPEIAGVIEFFNTWQRFDDGDFKTPRTFPYFSNKACYGRHTCYWGIVKLLKGYSFIPPAQRTPDVERTIGNCIEFILRHEVLYGSHHPDRIIRAGVNELTFPNLWWDDFLSILVLLAREGVKDRRTTRALDLLRSKQQPDGTWALEHRVPDLIIPMGKKNGVNAFITERAQEVLAFYG